MNIRRFSVLYAVIAWHGFCIPEKAHAQTFISTRDIQLLHGRADATFEAGDHETARKIYENVMGYRMRRQGPKAYEIGAIHNNVGLMHYTVGEYEKAFDLFQKGYLNVRGLKGDNHTDTAICLCNMGYSKLANNEQEAAMEFFEKALKARLPLLGQNHPDIADCHEGMGLCHTADNKSDEALEAFQKCFDIRMKAYGENHVETAAACMGLGMAYLGKNDFEKAEEFDNQARAILEKTGGVVVFRRNPESRLKGPTVRIFKARSKLKRKP